MGLWSVHRRELLSISQWLVWFFNAEKRWMFFLKILVEVSVVNAWHDFKKECSDTTKLESCQRMAVFFSHWNFQHTKASVTYLDEILAASRHSVNMGWSGSSTPCKIDFVWVAWVLYIPFLRITPLKTNISLKFDAFSSNIRSFFEGIAAQPFCPGSNLLSSIPAFNLTVGYLAQPKIPYPLFLIQDLFLWRFFLWFFKFSGSLCWSMCLRSQILFLVF